MDTYLNTTGRERRAAHHFDFNNPGVLFSQKACRSVVQWKSIRLGTPEFSLQSVLGSCSQLSLYFETVTAMH